MSKNTAHLGVLHQYSSRLTAFEWATSDGSTQTTNTTSTIIFVGGLFDDLLTVPFTSPLAAHLPAEWRLTQARLSSSSFGWGMVSLDKDVEELAQCVKYMRALRPEGRIILMGHSTGSQAVMHYAVSPLTEQGEDGEGNAERPPVDGYILQGLASDRQGMTIFEDPEDIQSTVDVAKSYVERGDEGDILPKNISGMLFPVSAQRYLSLASPEHDGQDDMFSSDLSDERLKKLFGRLGESKVPVQILYMGADQFVPEDVDKESLLAKWIQTIQNSGGKVHPQSGVVSDHDHNGENSSEEVRLDLVQRVVAFAKDIK